MGKRKGNVPKRQQKVPNKKSRKAPIILVVVGAAILAIALSLFLYKKDTTPTGDGVGRTGVILLISAVLMPREICRQPISTPVPSMYPRHGLPARKGKSIFLLN